MNRLEQKFKTEIAIDLFKEKKYKSKMQIPYIKKIVINIGAGKDVVNNSKTILDISKELSLIAGQKPIVTLAKKSISSFKLREKTPIGVKVTLRRNKMYDFLDKLINIALPRVRDFRGISVTSFDGYGNLTIGIKEEIIFPEIDYDQIKKNSGMNISIITSSFDNQEAFLLLSKMGMPFKK